MRPLLARRLWLALSLWLLPAICGCALAQQPLPTVLVMTATLSPIQPTETPIPPTATPAPPPTPTPVPFVAIAEANAALQNGNFEAAVQIYRAILDQPITSVDPRLRADAAFGYGQAALREGQFGLAVEALSQFLSAYPDDPRRAQAHFLRGDAYLGASQWAAAIAEFQTYLALRPGLIDSYAYERIGDAHLALGDSAGALANYALAVERSRSLVPMLILREKLAAAYLNAGNLAAAVEQYDAILSVARNPGYRAAIAFAAANALQRANNLAAALPRFQEIVREYPETPEAYRALQVLLANGLQVESLLRGRISYAAKDYAAAIEAFHAYTTNTPLGEIDPNVYLLLGRAYREVGNAAAANTAFETILTNYPTSPRFGEAWLEQGRTLFLSGDVQGAIARYMALAERHPNLPEAAEALWRVGYLHATQGDDEQSLATFEILGSKYPATQQAMDGLFRGGMAAYNQGALARAERLFSLLATGGKGELQAAGYLWLGRLYQINNQEALARSAYAQAAQIDPGGYYSLRAADLLAGRGGFVPPPRLDWAFNQPQHIEEAEAWLRQTFKIEGGGALWWLSPSLEADERMVRGSELWAVAAYEDAKAEFSALTEAYAQNPLALYQLASYYYRIGHYREAITAAAKLIDGAGIPTAQAPKYIAALRYPIAYADLVLPAAQQYGVDPLLVFSLIRQESLFQSAATSSAQAQGLMQIIPTTGSYIARKLGKRDYQNSDLYRPYVNVPFGVYYLYEQLQTFNGNVYAALAAYNGGPGNSATWLRISGGDPDLFLQAITFAETRTYVRRIYEQYAIYAAIYAAR
ncbi:MAG: tetratricopeptide repeat protein [Aggregatilineales bacterium]